VKAWDRGGETETDAVSETIPTLRYTTLGQGNGLGVHHVACRAPASPAGDDEPVETAHVILPRRGLFRIHLGTRVLAAEANTALFFNAGESYRVSHPVDGGDACLLLRLVPELADAVFRRVRSPATASGAAAFPRRRLTIDPAVQMAVAALRPAADPLEAEEAALRLLATLARAAREDVGAEGNAAGVRYADRAAAAMAGAPEERWTLAALGKASACSPYHLARHFKAQTGLGLHAYLTRLRLALALNRLAEGEEDIAGLAAELGFAHHSHLSAEFRRRFGVPPSLARERLTRTGAAQLRTILTAEAAATP
jgi:AraC family transcriptional regulator